MADYSEPATLREQLQGMDEYAFEHFVAELWGRQGWETAVSPQSGDAGIDVIAERTDPARVQQVIQAKRYGGENKIGGPAIQQYASLDRQVDGKASVVVVTTGEFTSAARNRADEHDVELIDGRELEAIVDDLDAYDLVERYADEPPVLKTDRRAAAAAEAGGTAVSTLGSVLGFIARNPEEAAERVVGLIVLVVVIYALGQVLLILFDIPLPF